jgi:hypothetical protein
MMATLASGKYNRVTGEPQIYPVLFRHIDLSFAEPMKHQMGVAYIFVEFQPVQKALDALQTQLESSEITDKERVNLRLRSQNLTSMLVKKPFRLLDRE